MTANVLYHLLSGERLEQKLAHARANDGALLLTGHLLRQ